MVRRKIPVYSFEETERRPVRQDTFLLKNFLLTLPPLSGLVGKEQVLLDAKGSLCIRLICRTLDIDSTDGEMHSLRRENCFDFNEMDEWILDIAFTTRTKEGVEETYPLRLPLSMPGVLDEPLSLYFDGTWLRLLSRGEVLNENSGIGDLATPTQVTACEEIAVSTVTAREVRYRTEESDMPADLYFPHGFNTNVGDVMTFYHDGTYHILYLHDRRHHGSRGGKGAHTIAHLTTKDLLTWEEQELLADIEHPYETFGTGTMFYHRGKYYMSYGIHASRHPSGRFIEPDYDAQNGCFHYKTFEQVYAEGGMPLGATVSVSDDGIHFQKSGILYHGAQNPSAYTNSKGGITLYGGYGAEGVWEAEEFGKPFYKRGRSFAFSGPDTALGCSSECPAFFKMGDYQYLIVGFCGYFRTIEPGSDQFVDAIKLGENIYDGLCVPMVAELANGRRLIAGWIESALGWGGALMQRELIQEEGGKLGMKWIPELYPVKQGKDLFRQGSAEQALKEKENYILECRAQVDENGIFALDLLGTDRAAQLRIDIHAHKAQITDCQGDGNVVEELDTPYEKRQKGKDASSGALRNATQNYAIPDVPLGKEFSLRMILRYSARMRGTVCDIELDGRRTMISLRPHLFARALKPIAGKIVQGSLFSIIQ